MGGMCACMLVGGGCVCILDCVPSCTYVRLCNCTTELRSKSRRESLLSQVVVLFPLSPQIPAGEVFETVLFAGNGIVDTILEWGGLLRQYHSKTDTLRMNDFSINYLG